MPVPGKALLLALIKGFFGCELLVVRQNEATEKEGGVQWYC